MEQRKALVDAMVKRQAEAKAYQPSWREQIGNWIYDKARAAGMPNANRMRNEAQMAVDFVPGVGDAVGANEAYRDYGAGNYGRAVLGAGLVGIGAVPVVGDVVAGTVKKGIRAYHGSPHDFDRFDMSKIGTGEGAQAYGHGLYFAESEDVAKAYRDVLSAQHSSPEKTAANVLNLYGGDVEKARAHISKSIDASFARGDADGAQRSFLVKAALDRPDKLPNPEGRLYEVNIDANPEDFLDWDKPLSEQPQKVQQAIEALTTKDREKLTEAYRHMGEALGVPSGYDPMANAKGRDAYLGLEDQYGPTGAVKKLRELGTPGIKYLDAGSRGAGDGSRNYVVFDDAKISIVRKLGIAGAVAAGVITQQQGEQMQEQGLI